MSKDPTGRELGITAGLVSMALLFILCTIVENCVLMIGGPLLGVLLILSSLTFEKNATKPPSS